MRVSKAGLATLLVAALAIRLALIATTFGSTDALLLMSYTHLAERFGIGPAYQHALYLNHPPLAGVLMMAADRIGSAVGLEFPDAYRLLQTLADCISALILYKLGRSREAALFFFASPAAIFLSGFHCNSDPTMIALLLGSVFTTSGTLFALASGMKIAPLPLAPFFLINLGWRRRAFFLLSAATAMVLIFVPAVITGGITVLRNVFLYSGSGYEWGFCGIGFLLRNREWADLYVHYGRFIVIVALIALFLFYWKRPAPLPAMIGVALLTMNFFAPAFGVQYLVWPLPFLLFALPRKWAYSLNVALSLFVFATYTIWSGEFPWWFANAASPDINRRLIALLALPLWLLYGATIVVALWRQTSRQFVAQEFTEGGAGN
jgi:hypothetical protein